MILGQQNHKMIMFLRNDKKIITHKSVSTYLKHVYTLGFYKVNCNI